MESLIFPFEIGTQMSPENNVPNSSIKLQALDGQGGDLTTASQKSRTIFLPS